MREIPIFVKSQFLENHMGRALDKILLLVIPDVFKGVHVIAAKVVWSENGDGEFGGILPIETKGKSYRI